MAGDRVPDAHGLIVAGRSEALTIRAERYARDWILVLQRVDQRGDHTDGWRRIKPPHLHSLVPTRRGEEPPVGAESHTVDMPFMGRKQNQLLAGGRVPDRNLPIRAARDDPPAVGAE